MLIHSSLPLPSSTPWIHCWNLSPDLIWLHTLLGHPSLLILSLANALPRLFEDPFPTLLIWRKLHSVDFGTSSKFIIYGLVRAGKILVMHQMLLQPNCGKGLGSIHLLPPPSHISDYSDFTMCDDLQSALGLELPPGPSSHLDVTSKHVGEVPSHSVSQINQVEFIYGTPITQASPFCPGPDQPPPSSPRPPQPVPP